MDTRNLLVSRPGLSWNTIIFPLGVSALSATPTFFSIVALLSCVILYSTAIWNRHNSSSHLLALAMNLALGSTVGNISSSTTAVANPAASFALGLLRGFISSMIAVVPLAINVTFLKRQSSPSIRFLVFPAIWATAWALIAQTNSVGRLGGWTPILGDEGYRWLRPYLGLVGVDYITAAWGIVAAEILGDWIMENSNTSFQPIHLEDSNSLGEHDEQDPERLSAATEHRRPWYPPLVFGAFLYLLTWPSTSISTTGDKLPLPVYSTHTTTIMASCVLPAPSEHGSALKHYLAETRTLAPKARIHLWPESAVSFESSNDTLAAETEVLSIAQQSRVWIGMSFDEPDPTPGGGHRSSLRRNGMALIGPSGEVFRYYKRNLVPIAESYSHSPGTEIPPLEVIPLLYPAQTTRPEQHSWPRNISLTTSICLDFTQPLPRLAGPPTLILAPARTWHTSIGHAMALFADARAEEVGAAVLWCDGGEGAVGGVFGAGRGRGLNVEQVGVSRSWIASFAVPLHAEGTAGSRTFYGAAGDTGVLFALWVFIGCACVGELALGRVTLHPGLIPQFIA